MDNIEIPKGEFRVLCDTLRRCQKALAKNSDNAAAQALLNVTITNLECWDTEMYTEDFERKV